MRRATYERKGDRVCLFLTNDVIVTIPRKQLQGLGTASSSQLSRIEILGGGTGLHWPRLGVSHYVPGLLNNVLGTNGWLIVNQRPNKPPGKISHFGTKPPASTDP